MTIRSIWKSIHGRESASVNCSCGAVLLVPATDPEIVCPACRRKEPMRPLLDDYTKRTLAIKAGILTQ